MPGTEVGSVYVKIGADIEDLNSGIDKSIDKLRTAGTEIQQLADRAFIENLKDMSQAFEGLSSTLIGFGKNAVDQALNIGGLENAIVRLSESAAEGQQTVDFIKNLALTDQEFSTESLLKAGQKLTQYSTNLKELGVTVEDILPKIADFADVQMVDVADASATVAKALSGTRGGITALAAQYGITTEKLIEYGAAVNSSGEIEDDALESKQAVIKILDEFSGRAAIGAQSASEQYENSVAQLNNTFTELKTEIGNEVIPTIIELVNQGTGILKWVKDLDPEIKNTTISFTALAAGLALAGQGIAGVIAIAAPFSTVLSSLGAKIIAASTATNILTTEGVKYGMMGEKIVTTTTSATTSTTALGSSMGALGAVLPVAIVSALIIALGSLAYATIEYQKSIIDLERTDLENSLKRQADSLNALKAIYPQATTAALGFQEVIKEGIDNILNQADGLFKLQTVLESLANDELAHTANLSEAQKKRSDLLKQQSKLTPESKRYFDLEEQIGEQEAIIKQEQAYIKERRKEKQTIYDAQKKANKEEVDDTKNKVKTIINLEDTEFNKILSNTKNKIEAQRQSDEQAISSLENLRKQYPLTEEQSDKLQIAINKHQDNIRREAEKTVKENETLQEKAAKEQEKRNEEIQKNREKEAEKQKKINEETVKTQTVTQSQILENEGNTVEAKKELLKIKEQAMRDEGINEITISKWKETEILKIEREAAKKSETEKKQQQKKEISELKSKLKEIGNFLLGVTEETAKTKSNAEGMAEGLKKSNDEARELLKTMTQIGNITAAKGGGTSFGLGEFMSAEEAFANLPGSEKYSGSGSGFGLGRQPGENNSEPKKISTEDNQNEVKSGNNTTTAGNFLDFISGLQKNMSGNSNFSMPAILNPNSVISNQLANSTTNNNNDNSKTEFHLNINGDQKDNGNIPEEVIEASRTMMNWATASKLRSNK